MIVPVRPEYISLNNWAGHLIGDDTFDQLPLFKEGDDWKEWGDAVASAPYMDTLDMPSPYDNDYKTWQDWAADVYQVLLTRQTPTAPVFSGAVT